MVAIKERKIVLSYKRALFPAVMTIISFVLFILVYYLVTMTTPESYYFTGLLFAIPFLSFGIITAFAALGKIDIVNSSVITLILIFSLGLASIFLLAHIAIDAATTVTTDSSKYEKVLRLTGYPTDQLTKIFPDQIPEGAKNIQFSYNPAFAQGGENCSLKFETDAESIEDYRNQFLKKAKWIGNANASEAGKNGIFLDMPNDFTIYLIYSKPYRMNDWNHGELALVAISEEKNRILFYAEDW